MIKKVIISAAVALCATAANAQVMKVGNVGVGVEVGLMGIGFQASVPVIEDRLVLTAGYNFYPAKFSKDIKISKDKANDGLQKLNQKIEDDKTKHPEHQDYIPFDYFTQDVNITAKAGLGSNFKMLAEFYPSKKSTFHITGGFMIGSSEFVQLSGKADDHAQAIWQIALKDQEILRANGEIGPEEDLVFLNARYNIDDKTYTLNKDELGVKAGIKVSSFKPYLGIGFGRAIPKNRVGFQFELGAWFHGKPEITSPNELIDPSTKKPIYDETADGIDGVGKIVKKIQFWPQMTFRLTGRIL